TGLHSRGLELGPGEPPELVVADHGQQCGCHVELGEPGGHDSGTAAEHEVRAVEQLLRLAEARNDVPLQDQVDVGVADDEHAAGRPRARHPWARHPWARHPLSPENVMVAMSCFCAKRRNRMSGSVATTLPAMSRAQSVRLV